MTIVIRQNVFETNSSSTHSVSLNFAGIKKAPLYDTIAPNDKGQIIIEGGDFASTEIYLVDSSGKMGFIAACLLAFYDKDALLAFEKMVKEHTGASEIIYDIRFSFTDGKPANTFLSPEYTSSYDYGRDRDYDDEEDEEEDEEANGGEISMKDIIKDVNKMKAFIFDKKSKLTSEIGYDG